MRGIAVGSASQDYVTNTHSPYFAGPQDKLLNVELAPAGGAAENLTLPLPDVTLVPDYLDAPYGHVLEPVTGKPSHLALHPGIVQRRGAVLVTTAVNPHDQLVPGRQLRRHLRLCPAQHRKGVQHPLQLGGVAADVATRGGGEEGVAKVAL